jgi:hypothetical protein
MTVLKPGAVRNLAERVHGAGGDGLPGFRLLLGDRFKSERMGEEVVIFIELARKRFLYREGPRLAPEGIVVVEAAGV